MNRSTLIIVVSGFCFALLAAVAVQMLGRGKSEETAAQAQMIDVLVASKDLKIGEELTIGSATWAHWPQSASFPGAVVRKDNQSADEAAKGRVRRGVMKGEPIMESALVDATNANFVAASLTPGKRAIALNVNPQTSVAGFVMPGDYVDVIMTYDVRLPADEKIRKAAMPVVTKLAAETVLENVRVVATDQDAGKKEAAKINKTVTLEVDSRQAEVLTLAGKMGQLSLALRGIGDTDPAHQIKDGKSPETTTDMRVSGIMRELMKGENKSGSLTQVVRIYNGTRVENVEVRAYSHLQ